MSQTTRFEVISLSLLHLPSLFRAIRTHQNPSDRWMTLGKMDVAGKAVYRRHKSAALLCATSYRVPVTPVSDEPIRPGSRVVIIVGK